MCPILAPVCAQLLHFLSGNFTLGFWTDCLSAVGYNLLLNLLSASAGFTMVRFLRSPVCSARFSCIKRPRFVLCVPDSLLCILASAPLPASFIRLSSGSFHFLIVCSAYWPRRQSLHQASVILIVCSAYGPRCPSLYQASNPALHSLRYILTMRSSPVTVLIGRWPWLWIAFLVVCSAYCSWRQSLHHSPF